MAEPASGTGAVVRGPRPWYRSPFLGAGLLVLLVLGAILAGGGGGEQAWPAEVWVSEADLLAGRTRFHEMPGGPPMDVGWRSSRSSVTAATRVEKFDGSFELISSRRGPLGPLFGDAFTPTRHYSTTGDVAEEPGGRWFRLLPVE